MGVILPREATPPLKEKEKSLASKEPLPPVALKTASEKVTETVLLSDAKEVDKITGTTSS